MSRPSRPLSAIVALALGLQGCATVHLKEHRHPGPGAAVVVKVTWDDDGVARLVGGVRARLEREGHPFSIEATTDADRFLLFEDLAPGRYRLVLWGDGLRPVARPFDLEARRRVTARARLDALEAVGGGGDGLKEGALFALKVAGVVVLVAAVAGLVFLALALEGAADDDCRDGRRARD